MKRQVFFHLSDFQNSFFIRKRESETSDSLPVWVVTTAVPVGKHSDRRSQMFYKIEARKNLAIFTGKHLCWRFILINFIKKRLQHRCFPANIAKCLSTALYIEHFVPIHFSECLCDDRILSIFGYKIDIFHIS